MSRKPLSLPQIVILALLWITICYIILTGSEQIDGPLILSIIISGTLVFIPLLKFLKNREKQSFIHIFAYILHNLIFLIAFYLYFVAQSNSYLYFCIINKAIKTN